MQSRENVGEDLSATAKAQATILAAQEANRHIDDFLSIACHELKTPLTSIKGFVQLSTRRLQQLENQGSNPDSSEIAHIHTLLSRTTNQIERLNNLVNDFLDVTRLQCGHIEFSPEDCDLVKITQNILQKKQNMHPARKISMLDPIPMELMIVADPLRISQAVTNYLSNALKYTSASYPIFVQLESTSTHAMLSVIDKGPGLSEAEQRQIWQRFYRVERIEVQNGSDIGLGLGLYLNETIIQKHRGQVGVESQPGQGSRFWFTLPLATST